MMITSTKENKTQSMPSQLPNDAVACGACGGPVALILATGTWQCMHCRALSYIEPIPEIDWNGPGGRRFIRAVAEMIAERLIKEQQQENDDNSSI